MDSVAALSVGTRLNRIHNTTSKFQRDLVKSSSTEGAGEEDGPTGSPLDQHGWSPRQHREFQAGKAEKFFTTIGILGQGSLGFVEEVKVNGGDYVSIARKSVFEVGKSAGEARKKYIEEEAEILKKLENEHIVSFIGTCEGTTVTNIQFYSLLTAPVGDENLEQFLSRFSSDKAKRRRKHREWVRTWFSCLASALEYIHAQGIQHGDIKPRNIIHQGPHVLFIGFGSAAEFDPSDTTSTFDSNDTIPTSLVARSPSRYCAPEVQGYSEVTNGMRSDIFSLGCVFLEMFVVLNGDHLEEFHSFCKEKAGLNERFKYNQVLTDVDRWFKSTTIGSQVAYIRVIKPMLSLQEKDRPTATVILQNIDWHQPRIFMPCSCRKPPAPASEPSTHALTSTESESSISRRARSSPPPRPPAPAPLPAADTIPSSPSRMRLRNITASLRPRSSRASLVDRSRDPATYYPPSRYHTVDEDNEASEHSTVDGEEDATSDEDDTSTRAVTGYETDATASTATLVSEIIGTYRAFGTWLSK